MPAAASGSSAFEASVQGRVAVAVGDGRQLGAQVGLRRRVRCLPAFEQRPRVLTRAADEDGQGAATMDAGDGVAGQGEEVGEAELVVGVRDVVQVVGDRGAVLRRKAWPCRRPCRGRPVGCRR